MNNENVNPNYKGKFLKCIVADYDLRFIDFDGGTVLVQEAGDLKTYFQLKSDYRYFNEWRDEVKLSKNTPMEILPGSVINMNGWKIPDSIRFCLAQHVRFPADDELEWYEKQSSV